MDVFRTASILVSIVARREIECSQVHYLQPFCLVKVMEPWTVQHCLFAYNTFVRNNECIIAAQCEFCRL